MSNMYSCTYTVMFHGEFRRENKCKIYITVDRLKTLKTRIKMHLLELKIYWGPGMGIAIS